MADAPTSLATESADGGARIALSGRLDAEGAGHIWEDGIAAAKAAKGGELKIDLTDVTLCDMAGAAFLMALENAHGAPLVMTGETPGTHALLERARTTRRPPAPPAEPERFDPLAVFRAGVQSAADGIAFLGEVVMAFIALPIEVEQRLAMLESEVIRLRAELGALRRSLGEN